MVHGGVGRLNTYQGVLEDGLGYAESKGTTIFFTMQSLRNTLSLNKMTVVTHSPHNVPPIHAKL